MTTLREAAQQALESLRGYRRELDCSQPCDAERALEAALEQHAKDVQWLKERQEYWRKQKSLLERAMHSQCAQGCEWQSLTEEEIDDLSRTMVKGDKSVNWLARAIEQALKEKNQ